MDRSVKLSVDKSGAPVLVRCSAGAEACFAGASVSDHHTAGCPPFCRFRGAGEVRQKAAAWARVQPFIIQWMVAPWVSPGALSRRAVVRMVCILPFVGLDQLMFFHVLRPGHVVPVRAWVEPALSPFGEKSGRRARDRARVAWASVSARARRASFDGALRSQLWEMSTVCVCGGEGATHLPLPVRLAQSFLLHCLQFGCL